MTLITTNAGDMLASNTIEGQIWELCVRHDQWQRDPVKNPNAANRVTWSITGTTPSVSAQVNFKVAPVSNQDGQIVLGIVEYLLETGFSSVSNVIKSRKPSGYLVELLFYAQALENNPTKNPTGRNNVSINFDADTDTCTGSFTLDLDPLIDGTDGTPKFYARPYLG